MAALTNYAEDFIINWFLRNDAETATPPATIYVGLLTAVTDAEAGTVTEATGGTYARQSVTFTDPAGTGATANAGAVTFNADADLGTITHIGLYDAATAGNLLATADITPDAVVNNGDTFEIAIGDLDFTLD